MGKGRDLILPMVGSTERLRALVSWKNFNFVVHFLAAAAFVRECGQWIWHQGNFILGFDWCLGLFVLTAGIAALICVVGVVVSMIYIPAALVVLSGIVGALIIRPLLWLFHVPNHLPSWLETVLGILMIVVGLVVISIVLILIPEKIRKKIANFFQGLIFILLLLAVLGVSVFVVVKVGPQQLESVPFLFYLVRTVGWAAMFGVVVLLLRSFASRKSSTTAETTS